MLDSIGGRKAAALLIVIVIAAVAVVIKGDITENFKELLVTCLGIFVGGNAVEHAANAATSRAEAQAGAVSAIYPPEAELSSASTDMSAVEAKLNTIADAAAINQQGLAAILERVQYLVDRIQGKG